MCFLIRILPTGIACSIEIKNACEGAYSIVERHLPSDVDYDENCTRLKFLKRIGAHILLVKSYYHFTDFQPIRRYAITKKSNYKFFILNFVWS